MDNVGLLGLVGGGGLLSVSVRQHACLRGYAVRRVDGECSEGSPRHIAMELFYLRSSGWWPCGGAGL